ncbi:hypothetical protein C8R43DRAFT_960775 [Mycena crocata]|nr:hypothetical protein C8R43DRAFT_960775 [Mycena crocata]
MPIFCSPPPSMRDDVSVRTSATENASSAWFDEDPPLLLSRVLGLAWLWTLLECVTASVAAKMRGHTRAVAWAAAFMIIFAAIGVGLFFAVRHQLRFGSSWPQPGDGATQSMDFSNPDW